MARPTPNPPALDAFGMTLVGASKITAQAAPILLLAYFSKTTSPEAVGFLAFISGLLAVVSLLSDLGLSDAMGRFLHPFPNLLSPIINLEILIATGAGALLWLSDLMIPWAGGRGPLLGAAVASSAFYVLVAGLTGQGRLRTGALFHGASAIAFMALAVGLHQLGCEATTALLWSRLLTWALASGVLLLLYSARGQYHWFPIQIALPGAVVAFAVSTFWFHAVELAINQIDVVLARALLGDAPAGDFKTASLLGMAPMAVGTLVSAALLPVLVRFHQHDPQKARRLVITLSAALALLLCFSCLSGLWLAKPLLTLFFTPRIAIEGHGVFLFTLLATSFYVTGMPIQEWLLATDASRFVRTTATLRAAAFFPLALWLTHRFGIIGLAAAHALVYAFFLATYLVYFFRNPRQTPAPGKGLPV